MTRAFLWFVMVATLGGCVGDVSEDANASASVSYVETADVGPFISGDTSNIAPFQAPAGAGWEVAVHVHEGDVIESVSLAAIPTGKRPPSLTLAKDTNGLRQAIVGAEAYDYGIHFDVGVVVDSSLFFLVFTSGDGADVDRAPVVQLACD